MSELDFDELDKAVSALMGDVSSSAPQPPKRDDGTKTITIPSTLPENATLPQNNPTTSVGNSSRRTNEASKMHTEPATRTADVPSVTTAHEEMAADSAPVAEQKPEAPAQSAVVSERQTLPTRRSGRFMDVVHPSSDMKNPLNTAPSSRPTRTGVSLEPMSSVASAITEANEADVTVQKDAPETQEVSSKSQVEEPAPEQQHDWLDPLASFEELETEPETASATSGEQARDDEATAADEAALTALIDEPEKEPLPLVSPFLANTKVEKRPLGGSLETAEVPEDAAPVEQEAPVPKENEMHEEEQLPVDPVETAAKASLPAELQTDLVAIESDSGGFTEEAPVDEVKEAPSVPEKAAASPVPVKEAQPQQRIGAASITPQYKETASTGDQSNGSIYDTAAYHQPLAHPPKKKSGWLWVIWVLLLLVLGGGGAAALYYAGLI